MLLNRSRDYTLLSLRNICVTNDHGYVPFVVITILFFPHWWLFTRFVTRVTVTQWVPLVEQQLLTLAEHMRSLRVFSWVRVAQSLVFCVMFCRSLFVLLFYCIVFNTFVYILWSHCFKLFLSCGYMLHTLALVIWYRILWCFCVLSHLLDCIS